MSVVFTSEHQAKIAQNAIDAGERFVDEIDQADAHQGPAIEVTMARVNDSMLSEAATVAIARDITRERPPRRSWKTIAEILSRLLKSGLGRFSER